MMCHVPSMAVFVKNLLSVVLVLLLLLLLLLLLRDSYRANLLPLGGQKYSSCQEPTSDSLAEVYLRVYCRYSVVVSKSRNKFMPLLKSALPDSQITLWIYDINSRYKPKKITLFQNNHQYKRIKTS
jgi:hypothetical protein